MCVTDVSALGTCCIVLPLKLGVSLVAMLWLGLCQFKTDE